LNIDIKRVNAGLSQERLANLLKVDRSTVAKWETGKSMPRAELLPKIAKILGCTVDDLLND
jgi:transcriptional regulator with XRE-family HTH domain